MEWPLEAGASGAAYAAAIGLNAFRDVEVAEELIPSGKPERLKVSPESRRKDIVKMVSSHFGFSVFEILNWL